MSFGRPRGRCAKPRFGALLDGASCTHPNSLEDAVPRFVELALKRIAEPVEVL
jgi:hypothetical protein